MRLILVDVDLQLREKFSPLAYSRPIWELRVAMSTLGDKLIAKIGLPDVACFVPEYMAASYKAKTSMPVNDTSKLTGDDLLIVYPSLKAPSFNIEPKGASEVGLDADGNLLYARITAEDAAKLPSDCICKFLDAAKANLQTVTSDLPVWGYTWDLVLENPDLITAEFQALGKSGIEGTVEEPNAIRGSAKDVFIGEGAVIHPMVVFDAEHGPIYLEKGVEVHPFTRIEGPCYVGQDSILLGTKCREGNSIGPVCRVGGEVEESIIHGHSNKYHDGFLGHAYVGEWVNLGAYTTNSDLKNDYSDVSVVLDGKRPINTGSTKVGSLIGDHTKTSINTMFNTGSYVGAMALIMAIGEPLAKFIPSFSWFLSGVATKGFGKSKLYETARIAMSRRGCEWTADEEAMWDAIFELTAATRDPLIKKGRKKLLRK